MKELLELYYGKKVKHFKFVQYVYPKQYNDKEIYETEVEEPYYEVNFEEDNKSVKYIDLNELIAFSFLKNNTNKEKIISSAVVFWNNNSQTEFRNPNNDEGVLMAGKSHDKIYKTIKSLTGKIELDNPKNEFGEFQEGFLTSTNRFVDRKEAWLIAKQNNQLTEEGFLKNELYSEFIKY